MGREEGLEMWIYSEIIGRWTLLLLQSSPLHVLQRLVLFAVAAVKSAIRHVTAKCQFGILNDPFGLMVDDDFWKLCSVAPPPPARLTYYRISFRRSNNDRSPHTGPLCLWPKCHPLRRTALCRGLGSLPGRAQEVLSSSGAAVSP